MHFSGGKSMHFNKAPALAMVCAGLLVGCGGTNAQMTSAIQETLAAINAKMLPGGAACLPLPLADAVVRGADGQPSPIFAESPPTSTLLRTLVSHGLLQPERSTTRDQPRFGLSQAGAKYLRHERTGQFEFAWDWALCTGSMKVTGIESYTKPTNILGQAVTSVKYRYMLEGAADWAKDPQVQALSPKLAQHFQQPVSSMDLVQTSAGWRSIYMQQQSTNMKN
jgi:hypothetical protein